MSTPPVVTRFAPSPTGHLHIGGARSALFCWAFAKRHAGKFMLRIEDTDAARSSVESARGIIEDLEWLGIHNDLGPYLAPDGSIAQRDWPDGRVGTFFQAQRVPIYDRELERLVRLGRAYPAFDTPEETEAQRAAAAAAKQTYRYPRPAEIEFGVFNPALEARWARAKAGERHVVRFAAPREEIVVHDRVLGDVRIAAGELDDFVIRKADGFPTYHFAVVVDDESMGVTHVLRAQEHLANTPRHVALQRALGYPTPVYGHMPIICNMDGSKMSKRDKAKVARQFLSDTIKKGATTASAASADTGVAPADLAAFLAKENDSNEIAAKIASRFGLTLPEIEVADFRASGYLPAAICNYLALLGWNPGLKTPDGKDLEKFDMAFLAQHFSLERIGKQNSKFDRAKLLSFNADAIAAMPDADFRAAWASWLGDKAIHGDAGVATLRPVLDIVRDARRGAWLVTAIKARAKTLRGAYDSCKNWLVRPDDSKSFAPAAVEKHLKANNGQGAALLRAFATRLAACDPFDPPTIHALIDAFVKEHALPNPGPIAQAVRVAVAGEPVTPGLGETLAVLGKSSVLARITRCLEALAS
ncbi:MAG: glutamate--tRNA ligase [Phycisphaerae bacterium]|nr:MAG: glutamate--tRNA ligase [Phycisphaerae bacterium]